MTSAFVARNTIIASEIVSPAKVKRNIQTHYHKLILAYFCFVFLSVWRTIKK